VTVEVLIKTFPGGEKYLEETVESFRAQGVEPVVVNDNRRNYDVWNEAFKTCKADYLCCAHHDDVYLPNYIKEMTAYLDAHPEVIAAFSLDYLIDANGKRIGQTNPTWKPQDTYSFADIHRLMCENGNILRCETVMYRVAMVRDMEFPDQSVCERAHDTQFWYMLADKAPLGIVMKPLVKYRVHAESDTQKNVTEHSLGHFKALEFAANLRPQDVEFNNVMSVANTVVVLTAQSEAARVQTRAGGVELLVCHEPPENAGTGVVVAERVRTRNLLEDDVLRYYVYPVGGTDVDVVFTEGVPAVKCPPAAFNTVLERLKPSKIEYHHLLGWPLDILNAPCKHKELWLHDSYLWCARYHSVDKTGVVCNAPNPAKCAGCADVSAEILSAKLESLKGLPKLQRYVANSEYTAKYAKENLGLVCEVVAPKGSPLPRYPRKKRVGYFGGFGVVKGTPVLLKAWRMLEGKAQLLMFCDVPAGWLTGRKLAGFNDVLVMGSYRRNDLPDLCNLVDLAVVPSINESYGMVKRELESIGVHVLATECGGLDGDIPPNAPQALAQAIKAALFGTVL